MALVTVVMPAYNAAPYLEGAVESVVAQTFRDLELIVVDDGSSDETGEVALRLSREDRRIVILRQANAGVSAARNTALAVASGRYIALLDSDDAWDREFLASQLRILDADPGVAIVTGNARYRGGPLNGRPVRSIDPNEPPITVCSILGDARAVFIMSVFRREVVEAIGGWDASLRRNEDYEFWLRAASAGFRFRRNPTPLGWYRVGHESLSADERAMLEGIRRVYEKHRHAWAPGSPERVIAERQMDRFEARLLAVRASLAIEDGDGAEARRCLAALAARRPTLALRVALPLVRLAPGLARQLYRARRAVARQLAVRRALRSRRKEGAA